MGMIFALSFAPNDFEGSGFALWRHLWMHRLMKEVYALPNGSLHLLKLPISQKEAPYIGQRNRRLLSRRLEQMIPETATCLLPENAKECFSEFKKEPQTELFKRLGARILPSLLSIIHHQWGEPLSGGSVTVVAKDGDFLPLVQALSPFVRSIHVVTPAVPDFEVQAIALEEWGMAVCFRPDIPPDTSLVILWDEVSTPFSFPKGVRVISFTKEGTGLSPNHIFFHAPPAYAPLVAAVGGIHLGLLSLLSEALYGEDQPEEKILKEGFSVSRVERPKVPNFWC